jgi:hypothetical protein
MSYINNIFYISVVLAIIIIGFEVFSFKKNKRLNLEKNLTNSWNKIYKWCWVIGIIFIPISFVSYSMFEMRISINCWHN